MSYIIYNIFYLLNTCTVPGYQIRIYIFFLFFLYFKIYLHFLLPNFGKVWKKAPSMFNVLRATNGKPLKSNNVMYSYVCIYICIYVHGRNIDSNIKYVFFSCFFWRPIYTHTIHSAFLLSFFSSGEIALKILPLAQLKEIENFLRFYRENHKDQSNPANTKIKKTKNYDSIHIHIS